MYNQAVLTSWTPTPDSFPVYATTINGAVTWVCYQYHTSLPIPQAPRITTFPSYLQTLEYWESSLLDNINLHKPVHLLAQYWSQEAEKIVIASNGSSSEDDNIISFGWKIVSASDKPLAEHFGLAFGHATPFWSEGYGLLS
eukprot:6980244-Ditylum_brightwellii.AAC.1